MAEARERFLPMITLGEGSADPVQFRGRRYSPDEREQTCQRSSPMGGAAVGLYAPARNVDVGC